MVLGVRVLARAISITDMAGRERGFSMQDTAELRAAFSY
jgi:hypothetical protein